MTGLDNIVEWMHFVSSIVGSCAWPCATLLIVSLLVFRFHKPLSLVISSLQHVSWGDLQFDMAQQVGTLTTVADAAGLPPAEDATSDRASPTDAGATEEPRESIDAVLAELAVSDPVTAILLAWDQLAKEIVVTAKRTRVLRIDAAEGRSWAGIARGALEKKGYLDDETARIIQNLSRLASLAAQSRRDTIPTTPDTAIEYARLAERVKKVLRGIGPKQG